MLAGRHTLVPSSGPQPCPPVGIDVARRHRDGGDAVSPGSAQPSGAATNGPYHHLAHTPERWGTVAVVRRTPGRWRLPAVVVTAAVLTGCDLPGFGAPDPKSTEGESVYSLWQGFFVASIFVGVLVWSLIIFAVVRYRRRDDGEMPSQKPYNIPVEVMYTVAPVLAVAVLFGFSVVTEGEATDLDPDPAAEIDVIGYQWSWQFVYTDEDIVITGDPGDPGEPPEMVLPVDQPSNLELISNDVNHSFWVPDFLSKRDLIQGVDNAITVTPTETGSYVGRCAEFCGLDHWRMYFSVRVVSQDDYEAWLDEQRAAQADGPEQADEAEAEADQDRADLDGIGNDDDGTDDESDGTETDGVAP